MYTDVHAIHTTPGLYYQTLRHTSDWVIILKSGTQFSWHEAKVITSIELVFKPFEVILKQLFITSQRETYSELILELILRRFQNHFRIYSSSISSELVFKSHLNELKMNHFRIDSRISYDMRNEQNLFKSDEWLHYFVPYCIHV